MPSSSPVETHQVAGSEAPVEMLPYPQLEEPVPVVERALAAEAAQGDDPAIGGPVTEPHASSRDEDHGRVPLRRAERDEIAAEQQDEA